MRSDLDNVTSGQVKVRSGQVNVKSRQVRSVQDKTCHFSTMSCDASTVQDKTCHFSTMSCDASTVQVMSCQVRSRQGQVMSGQDQVSMTVMSGMPEMRIISEMP